jgi:hypothetical protein
LQEEERKKAEESLARQEAIRKKTLEVLILSHHTIPSHRLITVPCV